MIRFVLAVLETAFPSVPVMFKGKVPGAAVPIAVTVIVEEPVAGLGLKVAVVPLGKPVAPKVTDPEYPLIGLIVI
jgi:hypothetical protein